MSGVEGIQAEKMQRFAEELRERLQVSVHLWDERLTSAEANRLLRETEMSIQRRGQVVDQMAAVLILQSWMEHRAQAAARARRIRPEWLTAPSHRCLPGFTHHRVSRKGQCSSKLLGTCANF